MSDDELPNDDQPLLPTIYCQFDDGNGLPIDADPADIAMILIPILAQIAKENKVGVNVSYGLMTRATFNRLGDDLASGEADGETLQ